MKLTGWFVASCVLAAVALVQPITGLDEEPVIAAGNDLTVGDPDHPYSDPVWFPLRTPARVSCVKTNCSGPYHGFDAIDWIGERGDPVYAAGAGIFHIGAIEPACRTDATTFGTWGWIDHGPAGISRYTHLDSIVARDGQLVTPATQIGTMGSTGDQAPCETNYLHLEIRSGDSVDTRLPIPSFTGCVGGRAVRLPEAIGYQDWDDVPPNVIWTPATDDSCFPSSWPMTPAQPSATIQPGVGQLTIRPSSRPSGIDSVRVRIELYHPSLGQFGTRTEQTIPPSQSSATFTGLLPGREYRALVSFHNAAGWSAWSDPVTAVVGVMPSPPEFRYVESTYSTIGYGWYRGANGDARHEVAIRQAIAGAWGPWLAIDVPGSDLYYRFRDLQPATKYQVRVRAVNAFGTSVWSTEQTIRTLGCDAGCDSDPRTFTPLTPRRFADSRDAPTFDDAHRNTGRRPGRSVWEIPIAGRGGVPAGASAAIVNVTALNAAGVGYATVYPCGDVPVASSLNYRPGTVEPNELIARLSARGTLCVYTHTEVDIIVDVVGHVTGSPYRPLVPSRFADSRPEATIDGRARDTGMRRSGSTWEVQIAGRGAVPTTARSATLNVTATGSTDRGYASVYPCGERPVASALNFGAGTTRANEVVAKLSTTGSVCIFVSADVHVIVDVVGYADDNTTLTSMRPTRIADSRSEPTADGAFRDTGPRRGGTTWRIRVNGRVGVRDAEAVIANITVTGASSPGYVTVHACGQLPVASTLNYGPGITRPNETIAAVSPEGDLCVFTSSDAHIIVDVVGFVHP